MSVLFFKSESTARLESVIFKWVSWFHCTPWSVFWGFTNHSRSHSWCTCSEIWAVLLCVSHNKINHGQPFKHQFVCQHYRRPGLNITALLSPRTWYAVLFAKLGVDVKGRVKAYLVDWHVSTCQIFFFFPPYCWKTMRHIRALRGAANCVCIFNLGVAWHLDHMCIFGTCLLEIWLLLCVREQCGWI